MRNLICNTLLSLFAVLILHSCMDYDMAYPRTLAEFTDFQVENADNVTIDRDNRLVTIDLNESADLSNVKITSFAVNPKTRFKAGGFPETLDLTEPYHVTLSMYYDFEWTIKAFQPIERYVKCSNQVGAASFDLPTREIFVYVSNSQRLRDVQINSMKLELSGAEILTTTGLTRDNTTTSIETVPCSFPMVLDCTVKRTFLVKTRDGRHVEWAMTVIPKEVPAQITSIQPWCYSADVFATFDGTSTPPTVLYRAASSSEWTQLPAEVVIVDGINVTARIDGLQQGTEYEVKLNFNGGDLPTQTFATSLPVQLYNFSFDDWYSPDNGTLWYPYAQGASVPTWDTANPGTKMLSIAPTSKETEDVVNGSAVRMESMYKAKFAAGNIYTGRFDKVDVASMGATLYWGTEFTSMPVALKGWYKYIPKPIDKTDQSHANLIGQMDKCQIQIFLTDWDSQFHINTGAGRFVDIANDPNIIAYGKIESDQAMSEYQEFTVPLVYRSQRKPKYIVISCCASYLGDFFTGGVGSTLYVDEFKLDYK